MKRPFFEDNGRFIIDSNLPLFREAAITLLAVRAHHITHRPGFEASGRNISRRT